MAKAPKPRSIGKETVEAMKPGEWLWDSELRGFGVRCRPSKDGSGGEAANDKPRCRRYYVIKFRAKGQQRWVTIGEHGSPWTPKQARMEALRLLAAVKVEGADPAAVREEDKRAITVEQLCRRYLAAAESGAIHGKRRQPKKASTIATDRGRIERHIIPLLGKRRVKDVMRADVEQFKNYVTAGKTAADIKTKRHGRAIVEGGAGTATRTIGLLGGIFTYAIEQGVIKENPVRGVKRRADNRRETRLSPDQYRALGKALAELETEGETRQALTAGWLLALSGCRRGEIEALRWSEVDKPGRCLRLESTKEGRSIRPAGAALLDVLDKAERRAGCDYVLFGAARPANDKADGKDAKSKPLGHYRGLPKAWARIAKRAKLPHVTPHTLRHSFASVANELGYTLPTIGAMLGHASGDVTSRYIHHVDAALVSAADRVAQHIWSYMTGEAADVRPMKPAKVTA